MQSINKMKAQLMYIYSSLDQPIVDSTTDKWYILNSVYAR